MFCLFKDGFVSNLCHDEMEASCIHRAILDLQEDMAKVGGMSPRIQEKLPQDEEGVLVIGSLQNPRFRAYVEQQKIDISGLEEHWEAYQMQTYGKQQQNLLICGTDDRGTMWGVYDLCERYLGIDPLYFWTDQQPKNKESVWIPQKTIRSWPKTFRFRGWFINDEDLLTEWKNGGGTRYIDYPFYGQVVHPEVMDKVIETALRLKQNLLIPASFIDIDNPAEEALVRQASERGLFVSQHHVEPMGVSHFTWDRYWIKKGVASKASYVSSPEYFEEIWTYYAQKWAQYPNVIWQFGLRGRADKPVWVSDAAVPPTMEARGELISSAIAKQKEIVEKALGHSNFYSTATLWMEGMELYREGHLTFPEDTMLIFADKGTEQMLGEDFYQAPIRKGHSYGVYYHVAFWTCGPHLVQGNPVEKIYYNYKKVVDRDHTSYSILNVGNIREVVLGIRAVADMTWDFREFHTEEFMKKWCSVQFGESCVPKMIRLYEEFYGAYHCVKNEEIPDQLLILEGVVKILGTWLIEWNYDFHESWFERTYYKVTSYHQCITKYKDTILYSLCKWKKVYQDAVDLLEEVEEERQQFYIDHIVVQAEIIIGLYSWLYHLLQGREYWMSENQQEEYFCHVEEAVYALKKLVIDRKKAEHGKWKNWYRGDKKLGVRELLKKTETL